MCGLPMNCFQYNLAYRIGGKGVVVYTILSLHCFQYSPAYMHIDNVCVCLVCVTFETVSSITWPTESVVLCWCCLSKVVFTLPVFFCVLYSV